MSDITMRAAFGTWPRYQARLREVVADRTDEQLGIRPGPDRWPLWATIGHLACQRVFWLCDVAGEPGAETTRFTSAADDCPGDDDPEHVLSASDLAEQLDATFRIVDGCLDRWTASMLGDVVRHPEWDASWAHTRGWILERVFSHDIWHTAELNEALTSRGLPGIDLWG